MTLAWVIGRGGLLGSALERQLTRAGAALFATTERFAWNDRARLHAQIRVEVARFAASTSAFDGWELYWAAGIGTLSSSETLLATETDALALLCDALNASELDPRAGRFALASSAGAIYAGSRQAVISEDSEDRPTTAYGRAKITHERIVRAHAERSGTTALAARISTLYGVGPTNDKPQGLLTHISRCLVRHEPIRIFVPLDTIRDYVDADDAAAMTIDALRASASTTGIKIIASEHPTTISEIVSIFRRLARRPPRIVTSTTPAASLYSRRIQFRSIVPPSRSHPSTPLMIGISRVLTAERRRYVSRSAT